MTTLPILTETTAPEASQPYLAAAKAKFGLVPNLVGTLAASPAAVEGYLSLAGAVGKTAFSPLEREVVLISTSVENACHYCVAAHTTVTQGQKLDQSVIQAIRQEQPIADAKLEALRQFTLKVVRNRGFVTDADVQAFLAAGYEKTHLLEVVLGVGLKTISNYINHIAETPLDTPFQANAWTPTRRSAA